MRARLAHRLAALLPTWLLARSPRLGAWWERHGDQGIR